MKQEIATELVTRLRSGAYIQGQGALKVVDSEGNVKNCCLGIVCDMAVEAGVIPPDEFDHSTDYPAEPSYRVYRYGVGDEANYSTLPSAVQDWAEMYSDNGSFEDRCGAEKEMGGLYCLSGFNDTGFTFPQIADLIERYAEDL